MVHVWALCVHFQAECQFYIIKLPPSDCFLKWTLKGKEMLCLQGFSHENNHNIYRLRRAKSRLDQHFQPIPRLGVSYFNLSDFQFLISKIRRMAPPTVTVETTGDDTRYPEGTGT
jgi:hypothetical protein